MTGGAFDSSASFLRSAKGSFEAAMTRVEPVDQGAQQACLRHLDNLTKPPGSLGELEVLAARLSAMSGSVPPPVPAPAAVAVFAGDHGVLDEGVTPWPQEVTAQMAANFSAGGAAINVFASHVGATVTVVDVGVASDLAPATNLVVAKVRRATANLACQPAMTADEARASLDVGVAVANRLAESGARCLVTGEMGIGNTTPSAAIIAALTGIPASEVTGRGTGIDDAHLARKVAAVESGIRRLGPDADPFSVLAEVGGLEIGALAGFIVGGAARRLPVVVDGVIALAAALLAVALVPETHGYLVAGHRSTEPGAGAALSSLGLAPVLDLRMRLGEGTGACLAVPLLQAAARMAAEMATFDSAGVTGKN